MDDKLFFEKTCPVCGNKKLLLCPETYVYKIHGKYFCSYKCKRAYEKEHPPKYKNIANI